jgi:hypothetical protein
MSSATRSTIGTAATFSTARVDKSVDSWVGKREITAGSSHPSQIAEILINPHFLSGSKC